MHGPATPLRIVAASLPALASFQDGDLCLGEGSLLLVKSVKTLKDSSLAYHLLHEDQVHGVVDRWKTVQKTDFDLPAFSDIARYLPPWFPDVTEKELLETVVSRWQYAITGHPIRRPIPF